MSLRQGRARNLLAGTLLGLLVPAGGVRAHQGPLTRLRDGILQLELASPGASAPLRVELRLVRFGRGAEVSDLSVSPARVGTDRVELDRGPLTEWFIRLPAGVEHGFDVERPPSGDRSQPLVFEVEVATGAEATLVGNEILFRRSDGAEALRYGALAAVDVRGRTLPAWMEVESPRVRILVDDRAAEYPVRVDPMGTAADRLLEINEVGALFGASVAGAGDVNGDDLPDLLVGAPGCDHGQTDEGCAYLYLGGAGGPALTAAWTVESNIAAAAFGETVAGVGDVNDDGFDDVVVGAPEGEIGQQNEGLVYLYLGSASGLSTTPARILEGNLVGAEFGTSVAGAGDVNNDGYDDVIVGAPFHNTGLELADGRAAVFLGSPSGLPAAPSWTVDGIGDDAHCGTVVAGLGDTNGDGYDDVLVVMPGFTDETVLKSAAFLHLGSAAGPVSAPLWRGYNTDTSFFSSYGDAAAGVGDVNGDGLADFAITDYTYTDAEYFHRGRVMLFLGAAPGPPALEPVWDALGVGDLDHYGIAVSRVGDVDGDGDTDLLHGSQAGDGLAGGAFVHPGTGATLLPDPLWIGVGIAGQSFTGFGDAVAGLGDVNGDGFADWAVGAETADHPTINEGLVHVYYGCAESDGDAVCTASDNCPDTPNANQTDQDLDGHGNACDCRPMQGDTWSSPGPVAGLQLTHDDVTGATSLVWSAPSQPGGTLGLAYDVLRSGSASDFVNGTVCLESADGPNRTAVDSSPTPAGAVRFYLVRPLNVCGAAPGSLGTDSSGAPRVGRTCP